MTSTERFASSASEEADALTDTYIEGIEQEFGPRMRGNGVASFHPPSPGTSKGVRVSAAAFVAVFTLAEDQPTRVLVSVLFTPVASSRRIED